MQFIILYDSDRIPEFDIGPPGRELAWWLPDTVKWSQLNYGQGEGQVDIDGCEWGFYFYGDDQLAIILHEGEIDAIRAIELVRSIASHVLKSDSFKLTLRGSFYDSPEHDNRKELLAFVRKRFPDARVESKIVNPDYGSWDIEVFTEASRVHICWGPQSGLGGTDVNSISDDHEGFDPFDIPFTDTEHAKTWLIEHIT